MKNSNEFFQITTVDKFSPIYGALLGDLVIPDGVRFAAIVRGNRTIYPKYDTRFEDSDRVLLFTYMAKSSELRKLLGKKCGDVRMFSAENFLNTYRKPIWKNTSVSILSVIMVLLGLSF